MFAGYGERVDYVLPGFTEYVYGGDGNDTNVGASGRDMLYGEAGNDSLVGGGGADWLNDGAGRDSIDARDRQDTIRLDALDTVVTLMVRSALSR